MTATMKKYFAAAGALLLGALLLSACARPAPAPAPDDQKAKHEYKDLKAEVFPVPEAVKQALPGLQNDNIYLYREIFSGLFLVVYTPDYSREKAVRMSARAFASLTEVKDFQDLDFWIIQVQPAEDKAPAGEAKDQKAQVVVWGVRPSEAAKYQADQDLGSFLSDSEYLLVDDEIIGKGADRLKSIPVAAAPPPAPAPEDTPAPAPGATAQPDK